MNISFPNLQLYLANTYAVHLLNLVYESEVAEVRGQFSNRSRRRSVLSSRLSRTTKLTTADDTSVSCSYSL